jgi:hypothetical protein
MGVIITTDGNPPEYRIPVLPRSYLIKMDFSESVIDGNEFNVLNLKTDGLWMLARNRFGKSINNFKLLGLDGKYLSSHNNKLQLKDRSNSNQNVSYNVQGELVMGDMCLTTNDNSSVTLNKCKNKKKQKWAPYNGNFVSMMDNKFNTCLGVDKSNNVVTKRCNTKQAEWDIQHVDGKDTMNYSWPKKKGKRVVLTSKDNPWFTNKDIVGEVEQRPVKFRENSDLEYRDHADYDSKCKGGDDPTNGRGYSYASSLKNCTEGFSSTDTSESEGDNGFILTILILVLIILLVIKFRS